MAQIIKEYTLKQIQDLSKNYKHCMIEDINSKKITTWNSAKQPLTEHLKDCIKRLNSEIVPEGYYYFCFSHATRFNKDSADKYLYCKGSPPANGLQENANNNFQNNIQSKNDLISVDKALNYITEIANLKVQTAVLEAENKRLKDENAVLEAELAEADREENALSDKPTSDTLTYLKETAPSLMALADRFFEHQDRKLLLEEKRQAQNPVQHIKIKREFKQFETGSPEHLNFIKLLYNEQKEEQLNKELDKIEILNPEQYQQICTELNLFSDDTNND